jgi:RimJ/RimL family protein N-acetyltransferase
VPNLGDEEISLRPWQPADAAALVDAWHDREISARLPVPERRDLAAARRWIDGWDSRWRSGAALDLVIGTAPGAPAGDQVCGEVGLSAIDPTRRAALIGWWLAEPCRGRGSAARAVQLMARWALTAGGLVTLVAEIDPDNVRSQRLASRCGFVRLARPDETRQVHVLGGRLGVVAADWPGPGATRLERSSAEPDRADTAS